MVKRDFKVIIGGMSPADNRSPKSFVSAYVTNSRLMGVLVVHIHWEIARSGKGNDGEGFYQFFYIEVSEIGIDSYKSLRGDDAAPILEAEQEMAGGLGSGKIDISEKEAVMLVQKYAELNEKYGEELPERADEFRFLLDREISATQEEWDELFRKTCVAPETPNQLINYFLMRYFARDAEGAHFLAPELSSDKFDRAGGYDTLCMNKIDERLDGDAGLSYLCESLIETEMEHRIVVSEIRLSGGAVASFDIISDFPISNVETAMKLERSEFISVYELLTDYNIVREFLDAGLPAAMKRDTGFGKLYLLFTENNNYLKRSVYRLNDDIKGMIYVTEWGQIILAAYSLTQIHRLRRDVYSLPFGRKLLALAKYEFKEDMFYDFVSNETGDFISYVEEIYELDPEEDR